MGKKKKAKAKVEETPAKAPEATCKVDIGDETKKAIDQASPIEKFKPGEDITSATQGEFPEKDPEPVNKPEEPETAPVEAPAEEPIVEAVPEGMVKIPCECINCKNQFDLFVPKGLGTPILYYRDCEKCR